MMHRTPEAATHSALLGQRENPFPNFEDSREGGMELSHEDHLEAKRIPKPRFFWGNANGKPDLGLTAHGIFSVGYLEAFY
jgi:hypothetical protein